MRSVLPGTVLLASLLAAAACGPKVAATSQPAVAPASLTHSAAEEAERWARAEALRARLHAATRWVEVDKAPCDPGALRTFAADSGKSYAQADTAIRALERTIVTMGADESLDTPAAHALLRTVLEWEAGSARPTWDAPAGTPPKRVVPAGLTGDYYNEETKRCEPLSARDTVLLVAPAVRGFQAPTRLRTAHAEVVYGDSGLTAARDRFFAWSKGDTNAVFMFTRVSAMVVWRDWAVVAVNRPVERQAAVRLQRGAGGATYIWRRTGAEWRLLAIARTWD